MLKPKFFIPIKALAILSSLIVTIPVGHSSTALNCTKTSDPNSTSVQDEIQKLQKKQFEMKASSGNDNLFQLMSDYDKKLAELSIAESLYNLNLQMRGKLKKAQEKSEKFDTFVDYVEEVTNPKSIQLMRNMAAMDVLLKELEEKTDFKISSAQTVEDIVNACQSKTSVLCDALNSSNRADETKQILDKFLQAYVVSSSEKTPGQKAQAINAYRQMLNYKFAKNANFEDVYHSALALSHNQPTFERLAKIEDINNNGQLQTLQRIRCCSYKSEDLAQKKQLECTKEKLDFEFAKCSSYLQNVEPTIKDVIYNITNYQSKTNKLFHYSLDSVGIEQLEYSDNVKFSSILPQGLFQSDEKVRTTAINNVAEGIGNERVAYDNLKGTATANILNLYRRGKLQNRDLDINTYMNQTVSNIDTNNLSKNDFENIAKEINKSINDLVSKCTGDICSAPEDYIKVKEVEVVNSLGQKVTQYEFELVKQEELDKILSTEMTTKLEKFFIETKKELAVKKTQIDAIKNNSEYQHLDQMKQFLIWDMKNRCSHTAPFETVSTDTSCYDGSKLDQLDHLVSSVGNIIAETDPAVIASSDLSNAGLAQRRVILSNMRGACLGLDRLANEQPNNGYATPGITTSCARIEKMYAEVNKPTESEINEEIDQKYGYNGDGRYNHKKKPSTWSDIATGAAHALPNAVGTVATPFFSGIALKNSIPNQEAYWKNMKLNNYAQQWWLKNTPQYPFGMYNPYYYPNYSGYNFNFANQTSLNSAAGGFQF